jgi:PAS domain S-box-containing protein
VASFLTALFLVLNFAPAMAAEPKRVLVVHSFGTAAPPFTTHSIAFETELVQKMGERVDLDEVSLNMARFADDEMQEALVEYLQKRHQKWRPDLVVPIGSPAGVFVAQNRDRLFADTPIVYCGLDRRRLPPDALEKNAAFVGESFDLPGLVEDILQIAPETQNITVVLGGSALERYWADVLRREYEPFAKDIHFTWVSDLSFDQMLEEVRNQPPHSFILLVLLLRDATGVTHNADEALRRMHGITNAPINGIFQHQLGMGIVGGRLYQAELEGVEAARLAVRILRGESASSMPPKIIAPLPPQYDWRELRRWGIDEKRLPPDSTVLFRTPTFWEQHRVWILLGASVCLVQALLISGLLANLLRRRRAERSLAESEVRFRTAADGAPVMIWMSGPDKLCTFFNQAWLDFTGRAMSEELGRGWAEGVHPDDREQCLETYRSAFEAHESFVIHCRLRRHDGEYRRVSANGVPRFDPQKKFGGYIGACVDVTDLLEKERALHVIEARVTLAAEAARLGVWELDTATNALWVSDKARELFQFGDETPLRYASFQERVHPEDRASRDTVVKRAIETLGGYEIEYRALLPDGTLRWIAARGRCLNDEPGKPPRLLGVSMDVTERKQAQELFQLAAEEARQRREQLNLLSRVSLLGEMTASLAHELSQPLSAIMSNANAAIRFIDDASADPDTLREIMVDVVAAARRASNTVGDVRNAIKNGSAIRGRINLNDVVTSVTHMVQPDAAIHGCDLQTVLAKNLPAIEGDPNQMQQVLINLVSNAFDAMSATVQARREVEISTEDREGIVRVAVRDFGTGILHEARERLFEQFFTTKEQGLGMGLAIVRSIIEAHQGRIEVENAEGGGARFYFDLPVSPEARPRASSPASPRAVTAEASPG